MSYQANNTNCIFTRIENLTENVTQVHSKGPHLTAYILVVVDSCIQTGPRERSPRHSRPTKGGENKTNKRFEGKHKAAVSLGISPGTLDLTVGILYNAQLITSMLYSRYTTGVQKPSCQKRNQKGG